MNSAEIIENEEDTGDFRVEVLTDKTSIISDADAGLSRAGTRNRVSLVPLALPLIFISVTLLGGLRFAAADNAFIFLKPPLLCLVFATALMLQFVRTGLIDTRGWFDESAGALANVASVATLLTIFAATTQVFNALLPEQGPPFWVVGFCFTWTLWTNLFSAFDAAKLLKSTGGVFALAFVAKYLILANLTAAQSGSWWTRIFENPGKEAFTWLLDLPRYSAAIGYLQFLALVLFLIGLYLTPARLLPRKH